MSHVQLYPRIIVSNSHGNTSKYVDTVTIFQKLNQKVNDPKMTPLLLRSHVWLYPRIIISKSHENTSKYVNTVTIFPKLNQKVNDPTSVEVTCVTLPKNHCIQVPWKYIKVSGYNDYFFKNLDQKVNDPNDP